MFKESAPDPEDLLNVPDAQQPNKHGKAKNQMEHAQWAKKVNKGLTEVITGSRGSLLPEPSQIDLCKCMNLLTGATPLPFDWDIDLYTNPPELRRPRVPTDKVGTLPGDKGYKNIDEDGVDDDYDDDDYDPIKRPTWNDGEVHITTSHQQSNIRKVTTLDKHQGWQKPRFWPEKN